jgi:hypothetical protein
MSLIDQLFNDLLYDKLINKLDLRYDDQIYLIASA